MIDWPDYELIDFGDGRKLEFFGGLIVDRPALAAALASKKQPNEWSKALARFDADRMSAGEWSPNVATIAGVNCLVPLSDEPTYEPYVEMEVVGLPSGQVGIFPEQFPNWKWIHRRLKNVDSSGIRVLNLFAYTGASTLAAAAAGASVVHVDASRSAIDHARHNASCSRLEDRPIRWIVEDALKFCQREVKRGNRYDAVILDPPTYGHGPKGEEWQIKRDLLPLLELCGELTERRPKFALVTCHTPAIGPAELAAYLSDGLFGHCGQPPRTGELFLETTDGRRLSSGVFARWPA